MRTSEVALQIYGCGHALETPVMYWKLLIEVRCRDIILRLADFPTSVLQFCHTQKTVCFGGVEPHVRVMPVQTFFDYTEREKFLRDDTELQAYLAELAVVPELLDRACTLRLISFRYPDYTKECFFRRAARLRQQAEPLPVLPSRVSCAPLYPSLLLLLLLCCILLLLVDLS